MARAFGWTVDNGPHTGPPSLNLALPPPLCAADMNVSAYVCTRVCVGVYAYVYVCVCVCTSHLRYMYTYAYVYVLLWPLHACMHACMHACIMYQ